MIQERLDFSSEGDEICLSSACLSITFLPKVHVHQSYSNPSLCEVFWERNADVLDCSKLKPSNSYLTGAGGRFCVKSA